MKKAVLVGQSHLHVQDIDLSQLDPAFRRATLNMTLATLSSEMILKKNPSLPKEEISFVLGTHFGEIGSSLDFLKTYNETQVPRPILFQNSLHNSTLGFTTIHLGLTGPAMTVSTCEKTIQSSFDLGESLLSLTSFVLVCFVDSVPEQIQKHYLQYMPGLEHYQNQAFCFLMTDPETAEKMSLSVQTPKWDFFKCSI